MTVCPMCQGPHELSQCPRWKVPQRIVIGLMLVCIAAYAIAGTTLLHRIPPGLLVVLWIAGVFTFLGLLLWFLCHADSKDLEDIE